MCRNLDILINNAGAGYGRAGQRHLDEFSTLTMDSQIAVYRVNTIGPLVLAQELVRLLRKAERARIINISSWLGSIQERTPDYDGAFAYSGSKAALNMTTRTLAFRLEKEKIIVDAFDPGWARTDMGGPDAEQDVDLTVRAMIARIDLLTLKDSGKFLLWSGGETDW